MNEKKTESGGIDIYMLVYMFIWVCIFVFIMWRCHIGAAGFDESLYLSIPYRLSCGDAMLWDEWNLSQLSGLATIPFVYLYTHIAGDCEGVALFYRYCSTILWSLVSLVVFLRFKDHSRFGAATASAIFMLYMPFGVMALSYNTYGILAVLVSCMLVVPEDEKEPGPGRLFCAGFIYAYAVLCTPHVLLLWLCYLVISLVRRKLSEWAVFTSGAVLLAVILLAIILKGANVEQILTVIPVMLSDPDHQQISVAGYVKDYIFQVISSVPAGIFIYGAYIVLLIVGAVDKKRAGHGRFYFFAACIPAVFALILTFIYNRYINLFIYPLNMLGPVCVLTCRDRRIKKLFTGVWIPGMLYSFCINMASNQYFYAISSASVVALVASLIMSWMFLEDLKVRSFGIPYYVSLVFLIFMLVYTRYDFVFGNSHTKAQTVRLNQGVQRGLTVTEEYGRKYDELYDDIRSIGKYKHGKVLLFSMYSWMYMAGEYRCASYSPWLQTNGIDEYTINMLLKYYELDEERRPDIIYIDPEYDEYADEMLDKLGYEVTEVLESGGRLATNKGE